LKHLGVPVAPKRSTLAYANEHRPWELYQTVFEQTLLQCQELVRSQGGRKKFRFKTLTSEGAEAQMRVLAQSWILPNVFNVGNVVKQLIWTRMTCNVGKLSVERRHNEKAAVSDLGCVVAQRRSLVPSCRYECWRGSI
jgi:hypothetical protein